MFAAVCLLASLTAFAQVSPGTPLDQVLTSTTAVRAGARTAEFHAGLTRFSYIPHVVQVAGDFQRDPGRSDVSCLLTSRAMSLARGSLLFLGVDQKPLEQTAWRPAADDTTNLFFETEAFLKQGRRFPIVQGSAKSYQIPNRKCVRGHETEWLDEDGIGHVGFVCDEFGEVLDYYFSTSFSFAAVEDASVELRVHCSVTSKDGARRITLGDFRASVNEALEFEN